MPATPTDLLERDAELDALSTALMRARTERTGTVLLVAGEAGIGKSSLIAAWTATLDPAETRILVGHSDDFLTRRTLGPLRDVARGTGGDLAAAVADGDTSAVLDAVMAVLDDPLRPVVLVLEDVHWADEATLDVVRYVGRRIADVPAVLVLTYRDDEVDAEHPLTGVLGALANAPIERVSPGPLSERAIAVLLGDMGPDPRQVAAVTGGNAFFVAEVARVRGDAVPATVADSVLARVRALSDAPRRAVETLSVMPGVVDREIAGEVVGDITLLAPAERRGLLATTVDTVSFRHELARRAVESSMTTTEGIEAHRRVLQALLDREHPDATSVLHHAVGAGAHDVVASRGPAAATEAFRAGAFRQAATLHAHILAHADRLDRVQHWRLLIQQAWTLYNLHRFDEARAAADRAVALGEESGDTITLVRSLLTSSRMAYMANDPEDALRAMERLTEMAAPLEHDELWAEVLVNQTMLLVLTDDLAGAAGIADAALAAARRVDRPDLVVHALNYRGLVRTTARGGDVEAGLIDLYEAVSEGRAAGVLEPTARAYTNLVEELMTRAGRWDEAAMVIDEAVAYYEDHDFVAHRYNTVSQRGLLWLWRGRWDEAEALLRGLYADGAQAGVLAVLALSGLARLAVWRGTEDAERLVEQAWSVALASQASQYITTLGATRIDFAWLHGRPDLVPETVELALRPEAPIRHRGLILRSLQMSGHDAGILVDPDDHPEPYRSGLRGDWRAAADGWAALGAVYQSALELASSGQVEPMLDALRTLDDLGAAPAARWVRMRLRDLGVRSIPRGPQPSTRENPGGLTDRQLDVLRLLADGLTNAQIADRLVVSVRTVDHHVSAILQRLGVATRGEAAAIAADLESS